MLSIKYTSGGSDKKYEHTYYSNKNKKMKTVYIHESQSELYEGVIKKMNDTDSNYIEEKYKKILLKYIFMSINNQDNDKKYSRRFLNDKVYNLIISKNLITESKYQESIRLELDKRLKKTYYYKNYHNIKDMCFLFLTIIIIKIFDLQEYCTTTDLFHEKNYGEMVLNILLKYINAECLLKEFLYKKENKTKEKNFNNEKYDEFINSKNKLNFVNEFTINDWKIFWEYIVKEKIINKFYSYNSIKPSNSNSNHKLELKTDENKNKLIEKYKNFMYEIFKMNIIDKKDIMNKKFKKCDWNPPEVDLYL